MVRVNKNMKLVITVIIFKLLTINMECLLSYLWIAFLLRQKMRPRPVKFEKEGKQKKRNGFCRPDRVKAPKVFQCSSSFFPSGELPFFLRKQLTVAVLLLHLLLFCSKSVFLCMWGVSRCWRINGMLSTTITCITRVTLHFYSHCGLACCSHSSGLPRREQWIIIL